jgi:hypothetical protein
MGTDMQGLQIDNDRMSNAVVNTFNDRAFNDHGHLLLLTTTSVLLMTTCPIVNTPSCSSKQRNHVPSGP